MDRGDNGIIQFDAGACFVTSIHENRITVKILGDEISTWRYFTNHNIASFEGDRYFFIFIETHKEHLFKVEKVNKRLGNI